MQWQAQFSPMETNASIADVNFVDICSVGCQIESKETSET